MFYSKGANVYSTHNFESANKLIAKKVCGEREFVNWNGNCQLCPKNKFPNETNVCKYETCKGK